VTLRELALHCLKTPPLRLDTMTLQCDAGVWHGEVWAHQGEGLDDSRSAALFAVYRTDREAKEAANEMAKRFRDPVALLALASSETDL